MKDINIERVKNFGLDNVYIIDSNHSKIDNLKTWPVPFIATLNSKVIYTLGQPKVIYWYGLGNLGEINIGLAILDSVSGEYNTWHTVVNSYNKSRDKLGIGPVKLMNKGINGIFSVEVCRSYSPNSLGINTVTIDITKMDGTEGTIEDLVTPKEPEGKIYTIDDGDVFWGTIEQFRDDWLSGANEETIKVWCEQQGYTLRIEDPEPTITLKLTTKELDTLQKLLVKVLNK